MMINNKNEKYTLHFMFSYKYSTYQIIKDPSNGKQCQHNISSYGETTHHTNIIHDYLSKRKYSNIFDYLIE